MFAVGSFWWINARQGKLKCFEPRSFAAIVRPVDTVLRFPFILHNTGAKPIVIQDFRIRFPKEHDIVSPFVWQTTRSGLQPRVNEDTELPAGFSVPGRTARQVFIEFSGVFPNSAPQPRNYVVSVEVKLGHRKSWRNLISFSFHADHVSEPVNYVAYSNEPTAVSEQDRQTAAAALQGLAVKPKDQLGSHMNVDSGKQ